MPETTGPRPSTLQATANGSFPHRQAPSPESIYSATRMESTAARRIFRTARLLTATRSTATSDRSTFHSSSIHNSQTVYSLRLTIFDTVQPQTEAFLRLAPTSKLTVTEVATGMKSIWYTHL